MQAASFVDVSEHYARSGISKHSQVDVGYCRFRPRYIHVSCGCVVDLTDATGVEPGEFV